MKNLSPLSLLAGLALLGLIVLAALHVTNTTLDEVVTILVAAAAGNEFPRAAAAAVSTFPPASADNGTTPAAIPSENGAVPAYPVSTK